MLNDKQSLALCGLMAIGLFASGVLGILDNFIVLALLSFVFIVIVVNFFIVHSFFSKQKKEDEKEKEDKDEEE